MPTTKQRHAALTVLLALAAGGCANLPTAPGTQSAAPRVKGSVLVRFREGAGERTMRGLLATQVPLLAVARTLPGESEEAAAARLMRSPDVAFAEPNYIYHALGSSGPDAAGRVSDLVGRTTRTVQAGPGPRQVLDDPRLPELWGLEKLQAQQAWERTAGDPAVKVAIIDTGVDYTHEDLEGGRVAKGPNLADGTEDPMDDMGHGSHVAGTIGATGDNGRGVAGVAYRTSMIAIKVLGRDGSGSVEGIATGIAKAVAMGARVINMSLGGAQSSQVLEEAVASAIKRGTIVVCAAGNDGSPDDAYPAAYPDVLAVGATDQYDNRAPFSNYGPYVKVAAPGVDILSTTDQGYKLQSGTSMASPHVAGAIAALVARKGDLTQSQAIKLLQETGDPTTGFPFAQVTRINLARALAATEGRALAHEVASLSEFTATR